MRRASQGTERLDAAGIMLKSDINRGNGSKYIFYFLPQNRKVLEKISYTFFPFQLKYILL